MLVEKQLKNALPAILFTAAFIYRYILMTWQIYPPGSDIGLHESVIKTITSNQPSFFINYYHMGGGISATNPGYHIFVAIFITLTGMPDYTAQILVACLFSAVTVLCVFLVVRQVWSKNAAYLAALLATFSGGDIAMLSWGGYPNIVALMLMPIVFYLYLQRNRFSHFAFYAATSLLVGSLFLTHVFSGLIFSAIAMLTLLFCMLLFKRTQFSMRQAISWLIPIIIGILLVSPYLYSTIPIYFNSGGTITGASTATSQALLETRVVSISILVLSVIFGLTFFGLSKLYKGKSFTVPAFLFAAWTIAPAILTQSYLAGLYVDFERFLYFLYLPLIVSVTLLITSLVKLKKPIAKKAIDQLMPTQFYRKLLIFVSGVLVISLFFTPLLAAPWEGLTESNYYQVMTPLKYDAIQWVKANTSEEAVFVADADFGWWLSGFAQRPTLSAVNPQFLILAHEIEPAKAAKNLLSTDYFIDNGFLQINYIDNNTNSLTLSARLSGSIVLHPFFAIKNQNISLLYRLNGEPQHLSLNQLTATQLEVDSGSSWASFTTTSENEQVQVSEAILIQEGVKSAKVSLAVQSKTEGVSFDWLDVPFISSGVPTSYPGSVVFIDQSIQASIPLVYSENQSVNIRENSDFYELVIANNGQSSVYFEFSVGFQEQASKVENAVANQKISSFDYKKTIAAWNVSYVVVTDDTMFTRFDNHQIFSLVYKNAEVEIFKVTSGG